MKDNWKLLEESLIGNKEAYLQMMESSIPIILQYYFTVYRGNSTLAIESSSQALKQGFLNLKNWSHEKFLVNWILSDIKAIKKENLSNDFVDEVFLHKFTEIYCQEISDSRLSFDLLANQNFALEEINQSRELVQSILSDPNIKLDSCLLQIKNNFNQLSNDWKYVFISNRGLFVLVAILVIVIGALYGLYNNSSSSKKVIDLSNLNKIDAHMEVIFEDFYSRLINISQRDLDTDEAEEIIKPTMPSSNEKESFQINVQTIEKPPVTKSEEIKEVKSLEEEKLPQAEPKKEIEKPVIKVEPPPEEKTAPPKVVVEVQTPAKDIKNGMAEIEPIKEDDPEDVADQTEVVVIKGNEIPIIPKSDSDKNDGAIRIGGDERKYDKKEFKDQTVIFYSFLEVKDVEKAKEEAFKILTKFGYKGEVLKKEKGYMILTATFPGKENHDRMIRKFNGLGTLYVGNDVAEFLDLYKTDLDKERSRFFPKYKPEDLPKEVTVNLYVFPIQKKK